jgi:hypothetical protein
VPPSEELESRAESQQLDSWLELMKRHQQYPEEDPCALKGSNLLDWTLSSDIAIYFANCKRTGEGAVYICDTQATGKTMVVLPVGQILDKMDRDGNASNPKPMGCPLLFCPPKQIHDQRARDQQAIYVAQMELRLDLERHWRMIEKTNPPEIILVKLVLPVDTEKETRKYLIGKGISESFCLSRLVSGTLFQPVMRSRH